MAVEGRQRANACQAVASQPVREACSFHALCVLTGGKDDDHMLSEQTSCCEAVSEV